MEKPNDVNVAIIAGKIEGASQYEGNWYHRVTMPAPDEYSKPGECEVVSVNQLGQNGQTIKVKARVTGYAKRFDRKDGGHGYDYTTRFQVEP